MTVYVVWSLWTLVMLAILVTSPRLAVLMDDLRASGTSVYRRPHSINVILVLINVQRSMTCVSAIED
jgi:hypothetical protein